VRALRCTLVTIAFLTLAAASASAHPAPFSYLDLRLARDVIDATLVVHIFDAGHDLNVEPPERLLEPGAAAARKADLIALLTPRLRLTADGRTLDGVWSDVDALPDRQGLRLHGRYALASPAGRVTAATQMFPYDPNHQTFINVYEGESLNAQAILDYGHTTFEYFAGTRAGAWAVMRRFVPAGVTHILIGPDHLLFLFGLLLLGGTLRQLALIVTAFTVAHSVTLSLAALNIVSPPARIIEPAIALSIVYVGADNLLVSAPRGGRDVRAWIAFTFGFIHGFGFAAVLREMNLPRQALGWSLFGFNLGVEIGQLAVVGAVASLLSALRARNEAAGRRVAFAGSIVVIAAGAFWFVQRVFLF
jgi:hydrogenase/urease accessory protein HupE